MADPTEKAHHMKGGGEKQKESPAGKGANVEGSQVEGNPGHAGSGGSGSQGGGGQGNLKGGRP